MIVLTSEECLDLIEICDNLDMALWRMSWPPEDQRRTSAVRMQKRLTEMLRNG